MRGVLTGLTIFIAVVLFVLLSIGSWKFSRWMNYKLSYNTIVQNQINKAMTEHIKEYHGGATNNVGL